MARLGAVETAALGPPYKLLSGAGVVGDIWTPANPLHKISVRVIIWSRELPLAVLDQHLDPPTTKIRIQEIFRAPAPLFTPFTPPLS